MLPDAIMVVQAIGFPAWAAVVLWGTIRISTVLRTVHVDMMEARHAGEKRHAESDKRLALIEAAVVRMERLIEDHEQSIRRLDSHCGFNE